MFLVNKMLFDRYSVNFVAFFLHRVYFWFNFRFEVAFNRFSTWQINVMLKKIVFLSLDWVVYEFFIN